MSGSTDRLDLPLEGLKMDRSNMVLSFSSSNDNHITKAPVPARKKNHDHCSHNVVHLLQKSSGTLNINNELYEYSAEDLLDLGEIGRGNYGTVNKMKHKESETEMAVKRIRATIDEREQKQLLKELDIIMNTSDCSFIVEFYGAIFKEGDCWICMELMTTSLDKAYKAVHESMKQKIPEDIIGKLAYSVLKALDYLKTNLNIIHRDVKPSNILVDMQGQIKLCDFGISGQLVDSIARTRDAGCQPYMAPERIDPMHARSGYDVRSDVWSLGLSLIEVVTGKFPYPMWKTVFDQLLQVVKGDAPQLKNTEHQAFSQECLQCVNSCLLKDFTKRPKYRELLEHPFIKKYEVDSKVKLWIEDVISQVPDIMAINVNFIKS